MTEAESVVENDLFLRGEINDDGETDDCLSGPAVIDVRGGNRFSSFREGCAFREEDGVWR